MGATAELLTMGRKPSIKSAVLVLGCMVDGSETARYGYTATGEVHLLDLVACTLDGEQRDWLLSTDRKVWLTDHAMDWASEERVSAAREDRGDGSCYPSFNHMSAVFRRLAAIVQDLVHCPTKVKRMLLEIQLFLAQPTLDKFPIVTGHAKDVQASFMEGGLVRDALTLLTSIEKKDLKTLIDAI